jgi:hypothetical protein
MEERTDLATRSPINWLLCKKRAKLATADIRCEDSKRPQVFQLFHLLTREFLKMTVKPIAKFVCPMNAAIPPNPLQIFVDRTQLFLPRSQTPRSPRLARPSSLSRIGSASFHATSIRFLGFTSTSANRRGSFWILKSLLEFLAL